MGASEKGGGEKGEGGRERGEGRGGKGEGEGGGGEAGVNTLPTRSSGNRLRAWSMILLHMLRSMTSCENPLLYGYHIQLQRLL